MKIKTNNTEDRITLLNTLIKMGYKWHGEDDGLQTGKEIDFHYPHDTWPCVNVDTYNKVNYMSGCPNRNGTCEYPQDIIKILKELTTPVIPFIAVPHIGGYTAKVYTDKIEVGCQTISLEVFDSLAVAVKEQRNK